MAQQVTVRAIIPESRSQPWRGSRSPAVTQRSHRVKSQPSREQEGTVPTWRSKGGCRQRGERGAYTFAGGFRAGLRGRGIHVARGMGPAARLLLIRTDRQRRTGRRRRAGGPRPAPPPAALGTSPPRSPRRGATGSKGAACGGVRGSGRAGGCGGGWQGGNHPIAPGSAAAARNQQAGMPAPAPPSPGGASTPTAHRPPPLPTLTRETSRERAPAL